MMTSLDMYSRACVLAGSLKAFNCGVMVETIAGRGILRFMLRLDGRDYTFDGMDFDVMVLMLGEGGRRLERYVA